MESSHRPNLLDYHLSILLKPKNTMLDFFHFRIDLLATGLTVITISILGLTVLINNRRSISNVTFALFSLSAIMWSIVNYLSYQYDTKLITLWLLRAVLFSSVLHSFFLLQFIYVFPEKKLHFLVGISFF